MEELKIESVKNENSDKMELDWRRRMMDLWEPIVEAAKDFICSDGTNMDHYADLDKAVENLYNETEAEDND